MGNKRKQIEELILKTMSLLEPGGHNAASYKEKFKKMSDAEFKKFADRLSNDDNEHLFMEFLSFKDEISIENIQSAAKSLNVPLEERVYFKHNDSKGRIIESYYTLPVGYLYIKKQQQLLSKKNSYTTSISQRSMKFNQVVDEDKAARLTRPELFSLAIIGSDNALKELMGPRADNYNKEEFYQRLSQDDFVYLKDLEINESQMLNIVDVYLLGMGVKSDLISASNVISRKELDRNIELQKRNLQQKNRRI